MTKFKEFFKKYYPYFILLLGVFLCVTFASECSFMYRTNEWDDVHIYYTAAQGIKNGKVMYRDLYDHKGPYLYFLHVLAIILAPGKYYGMYYLELIFGFIFAIAMFKIMSLFINNKKVSLIGTLLVLVLYYISIAFSKGDSAEEMVMPFYAISLYWLLKMAKEEKDIKWYQSIIVGVFTGFAFFYKFTLISFFAGTVLMTFILYILKKRVGAGFASLGFFLIGFAVSLVPAFIYFGVNNAFDDFFTVYFYNNIFAYSSVESSGFMNKISRMLEAWYVRFAFGFTYYLFILFGFFYVIFNKRIKKDIVFYSVLLPYVTTNLMIVVGGVSYAYYGLPNAIFAFVGVYALYDLLTHKEKANGYINKHVKPLQAISLSLLGILACFGTPNLPRMFKSESEIMEFQMKAIIEQEEESKRTVLNYGCLDVGVYYLCNIEPPTKYFAGINVNLPELEAEQQRIVDECLVTFVIACVDKLPARVEEHYDLIYTGQLNDVGRHFKYNMYKLR